MNATRGKTANSGTTPSSHASNLETPDLEGVDPAFPSPRECDCNPTIKRCVHFDGGILYITDEMQVDGTHKKDCFLLRFYASHFNFIVAHCLEIVDCPYCGGTQGASRGGRGFITGTRTYDEALAAFYAAEEALLRGDA